MKDSSLLSVFVVGACVSGYESIGLRDEFVGAICLYSGADSHFGRCVSVPCVQRVLCRGHLVDRCNYYGGDGYHVLNANGLGFASWEITSFCGVLFRVAPLVCFRSVDEVGNRYSLYFSFSTGVWLLFRVRVYLCWAVVLFWDRLCVVSCVCRLWAGVVCRYPFPRLWWSLSLLFSVCCLRGYPGAFVRVFPLFVGNGVYVFLMRECAFLVRVFRTLANLWRGSTTFRVSRSFKWEFR